jgi:anti-sigma factor (TIGR02949 family)
MSHRHDSAASSCRRVFDLLSEFVDGELSPQERSSLSLHLQACPPCEEFLKTFEAARALGRESLLEKMPPELKERLRAYLRERIPKP